MACTDKAHKVDGDGGAQACSGTPHAAGTSTPVALRPSLRCSRRVLKISYLHPPHCCADELLEEELVSAHGPVLSPHAARARPTLGLGHENW